MTWSPGASLLNYLGVACLSGPLPPHRTPPPRKVNVLTYSSVLGTQRLSACQRRGREVRGAGGVAVRVGVEKQAERLVWNAFGLSSKYWIINSSQGNCRAGQ